MNVTTYIEDYAEAKLDALKRAGTSVDHLVAVTTKRVRVLSMPERITAKNHNRLFGNERKRPRTAGWRVRRVFRFDR